MFSISSARYFVYEKPTDMRKSFDGLCGIVQNELGENPMGGDVYIFINKPRNRIKLLRWEYGGFVLFYKRLEKGTFAPPMGLKTGRTFNIDYTQLVMMITGVSMEYAKKRRRFLQQNAVGN